MAEKSTTEKVIAVVAFFGGAALLAVGAFLIGAPLGCIVLAVELILFAFSLVD